MRVGILSDLHLGAPELAGVWHNRLMFGEAETIARLAIEVLNRERPDAVFVLGDITQSGAQDQVAVAQRALSSFTSPWYVLPGNHDRAAVKSGLFDAAFAGHVLPAYARFGDIGVVSVRESVQGYSLDDDRYDLGQAQVARVLREVDADRPERLIVLSHFPLLGEENWAAQHGGKDAGYLPDGPALVEALSERVMGGVLVLCGHQHWHHIVEGRRWAQCVTASLIEYPMEGRLITLGSEVIDVTTFAGATAKLASASLQTAQWVQGRDEDRSRQIAWHAPVR